jgi:hypothetical protein
MTHPAPLAEKIAAIEKALKASFDYTNTRHMLTQPAQSALCNQAFDALRDAMPILTALAKDVAAMEEALGKLPRTADGVVVVPGTRVWYVREGLEPEAHVIRGYEYESSTVIAPDGYANGCVFFSPSGSTSIWRWDQCYSTRAAALAAAAKGQGKPE